MRKRYRETSKKHHAWEKRHREWNRRVVAQSGINREGVAWDFSTYKGRLTYVNSRMKECARCGETDYRVLTLHHRDPSTKRWSIKGRIQQDVTRQSIDEEIAKCDVLCHNCHQLVHWEMRRGITGVDDDHRDSG
jgi:hypothetical protein